jgi:GNAT superfamily N-acetyltransferase/tRNA(Leu) C34 or U34 (ribose-2'-O)-methylase TrmL
VELTSRLATPDDVPTVVALMDAAIGELQKGFLDPDQIESSRAIMGLDRQLIDDGTYFVVELDDVVVGCGGWSRRATLYGGDHSAGRDASLLDPATQPAKVRAMYTHPAYTRRGVGRLILRRCEEAALAEGFRTLDLMSTLSGEPLYRAAGFEPIERVEDPAGGTPVPLIRMRPTVAKAAAGAIEHLPIAVVPGLPAAMTALRKAGVWTVGLDAGADRSVFDLPLGPEPVALVLGAEGGGLSRLVRQRCEVVVAIPQRGTLASLNVSAAGAVACFELARRRSS